MTWSEIFAVCCPNLSFLSNALFNFYNFHMALSTVLQKCWKLHNFRDKTCVKRLRTEEYSGLYIAFSKHLHLQMENPTNSNEQQSLQKNVDVTLDIVNFNHPDRTNDSKRNFIPNTDMVLISSKPTWKLSTAKKTFASPKKTISPVPSPVWYFAASSTKRLPWGTQIWNLSVVADKKVIFALLNCNLMFFKCLFLATNKFLLLFVTNCVCQFFLKSSGIKPQRKISLVK